MRNKLYTLIMVTAVFLCLPLPAGADDEYEVKAKYLFTFAEYVKWPGEQSLAQTHIDNICILGNDPFGAKLDTLAKTLSSGQLAFRIKRDISGSEIAGCQTLFISKSETENISSILARARGHSVLTISDTEGFARKGGIIELIKSENNIGIEKIKFIVNSNSADEEHFHIDAQMLGIAAEVIK